PSPATAPPSLHDALPISADEVGACGTRGLGLLTGGEDQDPSGLAGAVREVDGAADHLVGLARVDAQAQGDLDGGVELDLGGLLGDRKSTRLNSSHVKISY